MTNGDVGILDLKSYYEAANLTTITRLEDCINTMDWMTIELESLQYLSGYDLLWQTPKQLQRLAITNPYLNTTLKIWQAWKPKLVRKYLRMMTLTHHDWFDSDLE